VLNPSALAANPPATAAPATMSINLMTSCSNRASIVRW
jgi:hypothetical protein